MKTDKSNPGDAEHPHQVCPFCHFEWRGPKARKSNQCPRCRKTIWHELKIRSLIEFQG